MIYVLYIYIYIIYIYVTSECGCQFYIREFNNNECQYKCKKPTKHCIWKQDFASNPGIRGCECDKDCEFGEKNPAHA